MPSNSNTTNIFVSVLIIRASYRLSPHHPHPGLRCTKEKQQQTIQSSPPNAVVSSAKKRIRGIRLSYYENILFGKGVGGEIYPGSFYWIPMVQFEEGYFWENTFLGGFFVEGMWCFSEVKISSTTGNISEKVVGNGFFILNFIDG